MKVNEAFSQVATLNIRRAATEDLSAIVKMAVKLARQHENYDKKRFNMANFEPLEKTHTDYLSKQLLNKNAAFLVAEMDGRIVGFAFLRLEPKSFGWFDEGTWLHDIYFEDTVRSRGMGTRLFEAIIKEAKALGSDNLMLSVSPHNTTAQNFFTKIGFRQTMQEMRLDFESGGNAK